MRVRAATVVCALAALAPAAGAQPSEPDAGALAMMGLEGPYSMSREGSGTSWQPDSTPMSGLHAMRGAWMTMVHGQALWMEAAATYSLNLRPQTSLFVYAGLPGEPALGPTAFMHRLSGMDEPEAPLSHHWLDSTHISFGVVTGGCTWRQLRLEAS